mgnify:CR=1 FL=1
MNTKTKLIVGVVAVVIIGLFAYNRVNAEELQNDFSLGYNSELSFRGVAAETSAIQSSLSVGTNILGIDFSVGALANIKDQGENEARISVETGITLFDSLSTSIGVVTYDNNSAVGDDTEVYIDIGAEIILSPNVRLFYNPSENDVTTKLYVGIDLTELKDINLEAPEMGVYGGITHRF